MSLFVQKTTAIPVQPKTESGETAGTIAAKSAETTGTVAFSSGSSSSGGSSGGSFSAMG